MYDDYSPRSVQAEGNCFYRCVALCLFGNEDLYKYVRFITAVEMIRHPAAYDVNSPTFALDGMTVVTPPLRSLIRDTLTDGCYAELIHVFAVSAAVSMSVQSYCTPGTHGVHGLHPYTIFADGSSLERDFREEASIKLMWTPAGNDLQAEPNHLVLLVNREPSLPKEMSVAAANATSCAASNVGPIALDGDESVEIQTSPEVVDAPDDLRDKGESSERQISFAVDSDESVETQTTPAAVDAPDDFRDNDAAPTASQKADDVQVISTQKGHPKLCYQGYIYQLHPKRPREGLRWRCKERAIRCGGTVTTDVEMKNPQPTMPHNHPADYAAVHIACEVVKMKRRAAETREKPAVILAQSLQNLPDESRSLMISSANIKRTLRNRRTAKYPPVPATLADLKLPEEWTTTGDDKKTKFVIFDNGPTASSRIIVMGLEQCLKHLASTTKWFMDGNFAIAPKGFEQLYVIMAALSDQAIPCAYALLQHKRQDTYVQLLQALEEHCTGLGVQPDPRVVVTDFESAAMQAVKQVFGCDVDTHGCFFHLTQATWRRIQSEGHAELYKTDDEFRVFCGMMDGLGFLPVDDVKKGMELLRSTVPPAAQSILDYFDRTYVTGSTRHIAGTDIVRRIEPLFPPTVWNVHDVTISDGDRTNNFSEAWNRRFESLVGHKHPSVWAIIESLRADAAEALTSLLRHSSGRLESKRVRKATKEFNRRLQKLCLEYDAGYRHLNNFLRAVGQSIRIIA